MNMTTTIWARHRWLSAWRYVRMAFKNPTMPPPALFTGNTDLYTRAALAWSARLSGEWMSGVECCLKLFPERQAECIRLSAEAARYRRRTGWVAKRAARLPGEC